MCRLSSPTSVSLDGYIACRYGDISWAAPDPELMAFHNEQTRQVAAHVCLAARWSPTCCRKDRLGEQGGPAEKEFAALWVRPSRGGGSRTRWTTWRATPGWPPGSSPTEELRRARDGSGGGAAGAPGWPRS